LKDPREGSPFFPGNAAIKHPHLLYADLISPTISFNPQEIPYTTHFDFEPGRIYKFDELPGDETGRMIIAMEKEYGPVGTSLKEDAIHHFRSIEDGGYGLPGKAEDALYRAVLINPNELRHIGIQELVSADDLRMAYKVAKMTDEKFLALQEAFGISKKDQNQVRIGKQARKWVSPELLNSIEKNGLMYPSIGREGNHRNYAMALLGKKIPHLEILSPKGEVVWNPPVTVQPRKVSPTPLADLLPPQLIISISGPSGMGKSSVQKELKKLFGKKASLARTYTTRGKRVNEKQGIDIKTVTDAKFEKMRESGEFTAPNGTDLVFENYGGKKYARRISDLTATPIVIIDQSFKALERMRKAEIAPIFSIYLPLDRPIDEWRKIIRSRKEPEKIVEQRIKSGNLMEKNYKKHNFDYIIRNKYGKLKQTASKIHSRVISNMAITNPPTMSVPGEWYWYATHEGCKKPKAQLVAKWDSIDPSWIQSGTGKREKLDKKTYTCESCGEEVTRAPVAKRTVAKDGWAQKSYNGFINYHMRYVPTTKSNPTGVISLKDGVQEIGGGHVAIRVNYKDGKVYNVKIIPVKGFESNIDLVSIMHLGRRLAKQFDMQEEDKKRFLEWWGYHIPVSTIAHEAMHEATILEYSPQQIDRYAKGDRQAFEQLEYPAYVAEGMATSALNAPPFVWETYAGKFLAMRLTERGLDGSYGLKVDEYKMNPPKKITPEYVRKNKNTLFVFGDNDLREGKGGQAKIRDEPNAIGLRTKKKPKTTADSYYSDKEHESNIRKMSNDLNKIKEASKQYQSIYYIPGIGEGRAKLKQKAPKTYRWLKNKLDELNRVHVVIDGSPKKDKKLRAVFSFSDGRKKTTHFGAKTYSDYTIHNDPERKKQYDSRHSKREDWEDFTTAGALSKWILWNKPSLKKSFDHYLAMFSLTGELKVKTSLSGSIPADRNPPNFVKLEGSERPSGPFYHGTSMRFAKKYMKEGKKDGSAKAHGLFVTKTKSGALDYARGAARMLYHFEDGDNEKPVVLEIDASELDIFALPDTPFYMKDPPESYVVRTKGYDETKGPDTISPEMIKVAYIEEEFDPWGGRWDEDYGSGRPKSEWPTKTNPPMDCPPATQDLELNTKNRNSAIKTDYIRYGPLNLSDEKYYEDAAEHWNTDVATAKKSKCSNCVAFDISPRMLDCMPGPVSQDIEDEDGYLGYCWMHHFKCHSARTCFTWAAGGPIDEDDVSYEWQERSGIKSNPMAPGYQSFSWISQDWRSVKVNNKGEIDYSEKCGAEGTQTKSGKPRLCLPRKVIQALLKSESGKEVLRKQARKKARAEKGERIPWHPRIKKLHAKLEKQTVQDNPVFLDENGKRIERCTCGGLFYESTWDGEPRTKGAKIPPPAGYCTCDNPQSISHKYIHETREREFFGSEGGKREYTRRLAGEPVPFPWESDYKQPKANPLTQSMSGQAIEIENPATGRKVFYAPSEDTWFVATVGYTSETAAKNDMKTFEEIAKKHIEGDFRIANKKKYNYVVKKGTRIPSGLNPRTGGPKLQQQAIQTRKSDEGESIFGGDPLLGESWKVNPPQQIQINAGGKTKVIGNQISRELRASGIPTIENAAMSSGATYLELMQSEGEFDITVVAPSSSASSLLLMDQIALFISDSTGLQVATEHLKGSTALGKRLQFQSSAGNKALAILVNQKLSIHDYYIMLAEAVSKAFRIKTNPPEGTSIHSYSLRVPIKFEDTLDAFIGLEKKNYSWKSENFDNMWFTMHTPYGEGTSIHLRQSVAYIYKVHTMTEKEQEQIIEDLKSVGGVMKKKPKNNPNHRPPLPKELKEAFNKKNKAKIEGNIPQDIFNKLKQGEGMQEFDDWLAKQKPTSSPPQNTQKPTSSPPQNELKKQEQPQKSKNKVKQVQSVLSKKLIKSLSGRTHPQTSKEKKQAIQAQKDKTKKKNPYSVKEYLTNPGMNKEAIYYLEDFGKTMTKSEESQKFKTEKLRGPIGSEKLFMQLAEKVQDFGEASGWIKDGKLHFRKGKKTVNEAMVTGYILEGATAFFHTHPRAWEPSQTSPDDFKVYHGLFTVLGIQDHFTVMGDRIDWFHFNNTDRIDSEEVARNITEIESEIEDIFVEAEGAFLDKTEGNAPLRERTKSINEALNKQIPEYKAKFKNYQLSPEQISKSKA